VSGAEYDGQPNVAIKIASGHSSFVDFLVYDKSENPPETDAKPVLIIEETKTADTESRNTGYSNGLQNLFLSIITTRTAKNICSTTLACRAENSDIDEHVWFASAINHQR